MGIWVGGIIMRGRIASAAFAAAIGLTVCASAQAIPITPTPNPADFSIIESPGQYTVINHSSIWYIYAFAVSNPDASNPDFVATTDYKTWIGLNPNPSLGLGNGGPQPVFAYASGDVDVTDPSHAVLLDPVLANYIAPGDTVDKFHFGTLNTASDFGLLLVRSNGDLFAFDQVNGTATSATPLPAALPMFLGGAGLIGLLARRRKQKLTA
jgi:hypothetical protein